jgi:hypothetical protein
LERKEDMKRRGPASPDLSDCLAMTFAVDTAFRTQRTSQLVYHLPGTKCVDGIEQTTRRV